MQVGPRWIGSRIAYDSVQSVDVAEPDVYWLARAAYGAQVGPGASAAARRSRGALQLVVRRGALASGLIRLPAESARCALDQLLKRCEYALGERDDGEYVLPSHPEAQKYAYDLIARRAAWRGRQVLVASAILAAFAVVLIAAPTPGTKFGSAPLWGRMLYGGAILALALGFVWRSRRSFGLAPQWRRQAARIDSTTD